MDRSIELIAPYQDVPRDLVDALVVALAEETHVLDVPSLDRRGFGAYRAPGRRRFSLPPR